MLSKINVLSLIRSHVSSLRDVNSTRISWTDLVLFYAFPIAACLAITIWPWDVDLGQTDTLMTVVSVLFGFMTTVYLFVVDRMAAETPRTQSGNQLLRETQANVGYAALVLLALMSVLFATSGLVDDSSVPGSSVTDADAVPTWVEAVAYSLSIHFALTMLMIIKRVDGIATSDSRTTPGAT